MRKTPQLILHVGAPKCGSTALQSALSMTPDLVDTTGRKLRYTVWRQFGKLGAAFYGRRLTALAQASAYGYASWPNVPPHNDGASILEGLDKVRRKGLKAGYVPIASCEGWISRADVFAPHLARWGHPPVEVVAFLRPVVDWTNSAFWQWGIWNVPSLDSWLARGNMPYRFGLELEAWSRIPNVHVRFAWAQPDAVAQFAQWQGVDLQPALTRNASSSPPLVGVLLRHRHLRQNGHAASTEFVVQRWCPPVGGGRLWAVMARHVHLLRPVMRENLAALRRIATDDAMRAICDDPRWLDESRYHAEILAGVSPLNDPAQLAELYASLVAGILRMAEVADYPVPDIPPCPKAQDDLTEWDAVLVAMIEALLRGDSALRNRRWQGAIPAWLGLRARVVSSVQTYWFNNSR